MKPSTILHALRALDWTGHVELPDKDISWLAHSLANALSMNEDARMCGVCSQFKDVTVETRLGRICEDCIEDCSDIASSIRDELEDS